MVDKRLFEITDINRSGKIADITVLSEELAEKAKPGQFLHILCGSDSFLRRPISVCDVSNDRLRFILEVKGAGTEALFTKNKGDLLDILGPLGHGFEINNGSTVFVGGGIGTFPLLFAARKHYENYGKKAYAVLGFRNAEAVYEPIIKDFEKYCFVTLMTDDGSAGTKGYAVNGLETLLDTHDIGEIMTCGPEIMMNTVISAAKNHKISCQASYEERMGCGAGFCLCCTKKINICGEVKQICVCKDGPVINVN